jgi:hypothetical protein
MSVRIAIVLLVSGFLTLLGFPEPKTAGGFLLLVVLSPLLIVAPTVFVYTATFAIVRRLLPTHAFARNRNLIAAVITFGLGVLAALPMALAGRLAFKLAATGDVVPHDRVVIGGNVLLNNDETPTENTAGKTLVPCEALCAALLDTPGVGTVTIAGTDHRGNLVPPTSYRLVPKGQASTINAWVPTKPEQILHYLPEKPVSSGQGGYVAQAAARRARENAIIAHWGLLLASEVTLSMLPSPQHHDLTITMTSPTRRGFQGVTVKEVAVRDRQGRVLLRRQRVTATTVFVPLVVFPGRVARSDLETTDREINPIAVLFDKTTLARPAEPDAAVTGVRDALAAAVMQPGAPPGLLLVGPWLATIDWQSLKDDDIDLLGKLIADARMSDLPHLDDNVGRSVPAELRGAIVARLLNPATLPELRYRLDSLLRYMPPGTFAVPTPDELTLLHDQKLRLNAPGLVERLADQGKARVPQLVRILQEDMRAEPWAKRMEILAVSRALTRLGPDAVSALPVVIELFDQPHTPLANSSDEMLDWRVAMVRMGRPIEDVPFPPTFTVEQLAESRAVVMRCAERVRDHPDRCR